MLVRSALAWWTAISLGLSIGLVPRVAHAWDPRPIDLDKTYPKDGQTGVGLDSKIFILNPATSVRLSEEELDYIEPGVWDPGLLEPLTKYTVAFDVVAGPSSYDIVTGNFTFETGTSLSPTGQQATFTASLCRTQRLTSAQAECFYMFPWECFDYCDEEFMRADLDHPDAVAFWVRGIRNGDYFLEGLNLPNCQPAGLRFCDRAVSEFEVVALAENGASLGSLHFELGPFGAFPSCDQLAEEARRDAGSSDLDGGVYQPDAGDQLSYSCRCSAMSDPPKAAIAILFLIGLFSRRYSGRSLGAVD